MKSWVAVFGWGSLAGLVLPALLLTGLAFEQLRGESEHDKLREANRLAWVENDWNAAMDGYRELLVEHPGGAVSAQAYSGIAHALENMGLSGAEVAEAYEAATRLSFHQDTRGRYLMKAGNHRLSAGQEKAAATIFRRVIRENSEVVFEAHLALGRLLLAQGAVDEALEQFQLLSESDDEQVAALGRFGISISYERLGDLDSAIAELDEEEASVSSERLEMLSERRSAYSR